MKRCLDEKYPSRRATAEEIVAKFERADQQPSTSSNMHEDRSNEPSTSSKSDQRKSRKRQKVNVKKKLKVKTKKGVNSNAVTTV